MSVGLSVQEKKFKIDFKMVGNGRRLGFEIRTISAVFVLLVAPIFPTKLRVNWPFGSGDEVQNKFSRWWLSWISDQNNFSHLWFLTETILAILKDSHLGNIPVKFNWKWSRSVKEVFFFFFFFNLGFTALSRISHFYWADCSSKVGENWRTRGKPPDHP